jgi:hypothetical protein
MNIHPTRTWQEEVRLGAVPSKTTKSGLEVVYDVEYIVDFISSLLSRQESELRKKIEGMRKYAETTISSTDYGNIQNALLGEHVMAYNKALDDVLKLLHA